MKKLMIVVIAASGMFSANAQLKFGVKGGLNIAVLQEGNTSSIRTFSNITSFNAGVLLHLPLFGRIGLQPEMIYSGQGAKNNVNNIETTSKLDYINIPVLLKYQAPSGFFAEAGPQFSQLFSAKSKAANSAVDLKDSLHAADFSASFGIGYLSRYNLGIDIRYNLGLANINNAKATTSGTLRNRVFQFTLFYLFGEKRKD